MWKRDDVTRRALGAVVTAALALLVSSVPKPGPPHPMLRARCIDLRGRATSLFEQPPAGLDEREAMVNATWCCDHKALIVTVRMPSR